MKGFYHVQMARERAQLGDFEGAKDHYLKGGNFYIEAGDKFPEDDEEHACMLIIQSSLDFSSNILFRRVSQLRRRQSFQMRQQTTQRNTADLETHQARDPENEEDLGLVCHG
jgi:hypothetical protein